MNVYEKLKAENIRRCITGNHDRLGPLWSKTDDEVTRVITSEINAEQSIVPVKNLAFQPSLVVTLMTHSEVTRMIRLVISEREQRTGQENTNYTCAFANGKP